MIIFITTLIKTDDKYLHSSIRQLSNRQIECYKQIWVPKVNTFQTGWKVLTFGVGNLGGLVGKRLR